MLYTIQPHSLFPCDILNVKCPPWANGFEYVVPSFDTIWGGGGGVEPSGGESLLEEVGDRGRY